MIASILSDVRYAVSGMLARPTFTAIVLATLTLGIGANTAIFSVVNGVLLHPLPYAEPRRLITIEQADPYYKVSEPEFDDYRHAHALERVAAIRTEGANVTDGQGEPERITGARVSDGFFQLLGVPPVIGRTFTSDEDIPGGPPIIILGYGLWRRRYGAATNIIGKSVVVNGVPQTVIGVMPPRFAYPSPDVAAWIPLRLNYHNLWTRNNHYLTLIAKLAPATTFGNAVWELNRIARWMTHAYPATYAPDHPVVVHASRLDDAVLGKTRPYLYALCAAVGFVQLIVCVNVASLLLARGESRRRELAIRSALGASRTRLVRQALTESVLYAIVSGALGLLVAWQGVHVLVAAAPPSIPRLDEVGIDTTVLLFSLGLSVGTGVLFGLVPALRSSYADAGESLKEVGRTSGEGRSMTRVRRILVISEVSLAVVILSAAGLMLRSFWKLESIDLGFRTDNVLTTRIGLPPGEYDGVKSVLLYQMLLDRVRTLRGVRAAGAVADLPVADGWSVWSILIDGAPMTSVGAAPSAMREQVTPGYFEALGIRVLRGRAFTESDHVGAPLVAVVNETMAKKLWPGRSAIGGTIKVLSPTAPWATVVGVVNDVRQGGFLTDPPPTMFFPHAQAGMSAYYTPMDMTLVIRTGSPSGTPRSGATGGCDAIALVGAVRAVVRELEPAATLARVQTMDQIIAASVASRRFSTQLLAGFGALALALAGIGVYGVVSYGVTQRTFEMGLRIALGAPRSRVLGLVVGEVVRLAAVGLGIGIFCAVIVTRLMRTVVAELTPRDPVTLLAVTIMIVVMAVAASWIPGRRAMAVAPIRAMRGTIPEY
jgi:putative ABC transport system permease protein